MIDLVGGVVGLTLTLMIFSYLIGDNPLYRIAVNLFVGVVGGYVAVLMVSSVLWPQLLALPQTLTTGLPGLLAAFIGWGMAILLVVKMLSPNFGLGRVPLAFLVGLGVAVSIAGALTGTLLPQMEATAFALSLSGDQTSSFEQLASDLIIFVGVVCVLVAFQYSARQRPDGKTERHPIIRWMTYVGQVFIGAALGLMFAGALAASVAYFAERAVFLWEFVEPFIPKGS